VVRKYGDLTRVNGVVEMQADRPVNVTWHVNAAVSTGTDGEKRGREGSPGQDGKRYAQADGDRITCVTRIMTGCAAR